MANTDGLKSGAFTGSKDVGNPYDGDLGKGIAYDKYEANSFMIVPDGNYPEILPIYNAGAKRLLRFSSASFGDTVLDAGSGTGILTLELLCQNKAKKVIGVEMSEGMHLVSRYKFHQDEGTELLAQVKDERLLSYWQDFRQKSEQYTEKVIFMNGDIEKVELNESVDAAIANQVMHWTDLSKAFDNLGKILKKNGEFVWNSASHFYNDARFPAEEYSFRFNDFLKYVLDEVRALGIEAKDISNLITPKQNLDSIIEITRQQGFATEQVGTYLVPVDLQTFVQNHVPVCVRQLTNASVSDVIVCGATNTAIAKTILNADALKDIKHKYDIVPIFRSVKL